MSVHLLARIRWHFQFGLQYKMLLVCTELPALLFLLPHWPFELAEFRIAAGFWLLFL